MLFSKMRSHRCFHWSLNIIGKLFSLPHLFLIVLGTTTTAIVGELAYLCWLEYTRVRYFYSIVSV